MAQIKQIGTGRKTIGTVDGIVYVTRKGVTYARATPIMPVSAYKTPAALKRQAIFKMVQMHLKYHLRTIKQTFTPKGAGTPTNRYYAVNGKHFTKALDTLAELYVAGETVTLSDIEQAISDYAAENPEAIVIGHLSGYGDVYLTGAWPDTITLRANGGDSNVVVIVAENGSTTTFNPDGSILVVESGSSGSSSSSSSSGSSSGSSTGSDTTGTPVLTISKSGSGSATVSAGGSEVSSGAELAANTEVTVTITPAAGKVPTATIGGNTVTLTEDSGTYTGTFQMPAANATLVINTGTSGDNGDTN